MQLRPGTSITEAAQLHSRMEGMELAEIAGACGVSVNRR